MWGWLIFVGWKDEKLPKLFNKIMLPNPIKPGTKHLKSHLTPKKYECTDCDNPFLIIVGILGILLDVAGWVVFYMFYHDAVDYAVNLADTNHNLVDFY